MNEYTITFARSARKELESLSPKEVNRIFSKIEALTNTPRPTGCRKLVGESNLWRIRVGDYRVVYSINDSGRIIDIVTIRHRSGVYR
ncbi:MAG: type II toxin-antitoxin system RelE/ParE family toxin [Anaerolineaceae bacterium]|jgi:mRNA interferase RelE/StbE